MIPLKEALLALYSPAEGDGDAPLRLTDGGLWHATPVPVLAAAVPLLTELGIVPPHQPLVILDAGAGDGRLLAALALGLPEAVEAVLVGLEMDEALAAEARQHTRTLAIGRRMESRRPRVAAGSYLEWADYATLGVSPKELDLVFNYPDGNERSLLAWLRAHAGTRTRLVILSPDRDPALGVVPLLRTRVEAPASEGGVAWSLSVYAGSAEGQ